jgi:hypothetical protein
MDTYKILHLIVNLYVSFIVICKYDIINNHFIKYSLVTVLYLLHIYHIIFYKLKLSDYMHHIFMIFICIPLALYSNQYQYMMPLLLFIIGIPGAINFSIDLLGYNKKYIDIVNKYIRSPGIFLSLLYIINNIQQKETINIYSWLVIIMAFINGIYYWIPE